MQLSAVLAVIALISNNVSLVQITISTLSQRYGLSTANSVEFALLAFAAIIATVNQSVQFMINLFRRNGPTYRYAKYHFNFLKDGSFSGAYIYSLQNWGSKSTPSLPAEEVVWFSEPNAKIDISLVSRDGRKPRTKNLDNIDIRKADELKLGIKMPNEYTISWKPEIFPPLGRGEIIEYEVLIEAKKTEMDAFSPSGSHVGFPVHHPTRLVELICRAPSGYRFELLHPTHHVLPLQGSRKVKDHDGLPPPTIEGDGSVLIWKAKHPRTGRRYTANYRFVRK